MLPQKLTCEGKKTEEKLPLKETIQGVKREELPICTNSQIHFAR
jgi:hypothetical protein